MSTKTKLTPTRAGLWLDCRIEHQPEESVRSAECRSLWNVSHLSRSEVTWIHQYTRHTCVLAHTNFRYTRTMPFKDDADAGECKLAKFSHTGARKNVNTSEGVLITHVMAWIKTCGIHQLQSQNRRGCLADIGNKITNQVCRKNCRARGNL